jgi:hypothetical protein
MSLILSYPENWIHRFPIARTGRALGAVTGPYKMLTS